MSSHQDLVEKAARQSKSLQNHEIESKNCSHIFAHLYIYIYLTRIYLYKAIAQAWRKFDVNGDETVIHITYRNSLF